MSLSCNKYGSNVVEKCLLDSGEEQSSQIIFELLTNRNISMLLLHPFGNYVIQTALSVSKVRSSETAYQLTNCLDTQKFLLSLQICDIYCVRKAGPAFRYFHLPILFKLLHLIILSTYHLLICPVLLNLDDFD